MLERINKIIEEKQMSTTQFADYINIQRPTMSHIISGRNNPSLDIVMKILTAFPDIDSDWLMFGDGKMYKDEISNIQPE
ncbi:MAG: helix-turn-helix transcriptional regulator, partial [Bacteroidales bacterium]|nr:helix-turn-helix transcriptional regulator [Bacteroidales bacterium]